MVNKLGPDYEGVPAGELEERLREDIEKQFRPRYEAALRNEPAANLREKFLEEVTENLREKFLNEKDFSGSDDFDDEHRDEAREQLRSELGREPDRGEVFGRLMDMERKESLARWEQHLEENLEAAAIRLRPEYERLLEHCVAEHVRHMMESDHWWIPDCVGKIQWTNEGLWDFVEFGFSALVDMIRHEGYNPHAIDGRRADHQVEDHYEANNA